MSNSTSPQGPTWAWLYKYHTPALEAAAIKGCSVEWAEAQLKKEAQKVKQAKVRRRAERAA